MNKEVDLSTFENKDFDSGSAFKRIIWYYVNILIFKSSLVPLYGLKRSLLKMFGAKIGANVVIKPSVNIKYPWKLTIGANSWIGENVWIDNLELVTIGENCCISQGALLLCGNHNFSTSTFDLIAKPIVLENGVWIGAKSIVSGGVTCFSHSILSIQSATSKDLKSFYTYRGNPAVEIKERKIQ
jgi:putative colanic acid biosynthesis acetyltransferase WcaF